MTASGTKTSGNITSGFKIYENFPDGSLKQIYPASTSLFAVAFSLTCSSCGGGGTGFTFSPSDAVAFSGDTITGGACSGSVSFNSPGGVTPTGGSVSGVGAASTSPMACPMTSITVPFSDFSSLGSGTYTLTGTLSSSASVTFTHGGSESGVAVAAPSVSASVTFTISDGTVTGVTGSI